ncbi:epoxide hydrolase, soluble (sEH) [Dispira simplex]|nr:epoxide hydrolase, soluble (sEH) [Dispira simplex]
MNQLVQFDPNHDDLVADMSFDLYGNRLCTVSSDHTIKVWQLNQVTHRWQLTASWKGHDSSLTKVSWAHPEFGNLIATGAFDRTIKIWQQPRQAAATGVAGPEAAINNGLAMANHGSGPGLGGMVTDANVNAWNLVVAKRDAQGMITDLSFAPHFLGLMLAVASSDGMVRVYETGSPVKIDNWTLLSEIDVHCLPTFAPRVEERLQGKPRSPDGGAETGLTGNVLTDTRMAPFREHRYNVCLTWCPSRFLTHTMAVGCGRAKDAKIYRYVGGRWVVYEVLSGHTDEIHSISWAPQVGRSYHLVATACKDQYVRIYRVDVSYGNLDLDGSKDLMEEYEAASANLQLHATLVASFNNHNAEVWTVAWNVTGTVLSSSGDDGKVRLWKATATGEWRAMETISTDQGNE